MTLTPRQAALEHAAACKTALIEGKTRPEYAGPSLRGADLSGADLSFSDLSRLDLRSADLQGALLNCSDLSRADFGGADLRGADARGADLRGASLFLTKLEGILLEGADVRWIDTGDLREADVSGATVSRDDVRWQNLVDLLRAKVHTARASESSAQDTAGEAIARAEAAEAERNALQDRAWAAIAEAQARTEAAAERHRNMAEAYERLAESNACAAKGYIAEAHRLRQEVANLTTEIRDLRDCLTWVEGQCPGKCAGVCNTALTKGREDCAEGREGASMIKGTMTHEKIFTFMDVLASLPAVKCPPAFAGHLPTFIAATVAQAVREAAEPQPGTVPMLVMRPAGEAEWMLVGSAKGLPWRDLRSAVECLEVPGDEEIEVSILHLTQAEIDAMPEFDGW